MSRKVAQRLHKGRARSRRDAVTRSREVAGGAGSQEVASEVAESVRSATSCSIHSTYHSNSTTLQQYISIPAKNLHIQIVRGLLCCCGIGYVSPQFPMRCRRPPVREASRVAASRHPLRDAPREAGTGPVSRTRTWYGASEGEADCNVL